MNFTTNWTLKEDEYYIYDQLHIRIIYFTLYTIVFCLCFFGNLLVILVVTLNRRLRSITNFFLANLAVADFCVAVFCVYQNFFMYIVTNWILGEFLCKMYLFIQSLSNTASIFILVAICAERYFAIIYPITSKQILTPRRLKLKILAVWVTSILYSLPKFIWGNIVMNKFSNGNGNETMCVLNRQMYNSKLADMSHFALLYCIPLLIMSLLYTRIALCLWKSSEQLKKQLDASTNFNQGMYRRQSTKYSKKEKKKAANDTELLQTSSMPMPNPNSSQNVLRARRGVIKMLIFVVCAFALCHLPFHARKIWQYYGSNYKGAGEFSAIITPLTFLSAYFNSGVNPLLYAFLSKNFRRGMKELLCCSVNHQPNVRNHTISLRIGLQRNASTRSTIKGNQTTLTVLNNEHSSECSRICDV